MKLRSNFAPVESCRLSGDALRPTQTEREKQMYRLQLKPDEAGKESVKAALDEFCDYKAGDEVVATEDFFDGDTTGNKDTRGCSNEWIRKGMTDVVESVSSNHHGGLQLNLVNHGRGWSNHVWRKRDSKRGKETI